LPKLSIITINLNNYQGLKKTLESVACQTFKDYEHIVIDGGSTDGSGDVIATFKSKLGYYVSETDSGIYNAMNKGILHANGEYCLFLNSGDFLVNPKVLTKVFKTGFTQDIAVGNCNVSKDRKVVFLATPPQDISLDAFWGKTIPHQSTFFKRDLFQKFGVYSENFQIHSDLEFFIKTIILGNCSYIKLPVIVSDYNLEGISGKSSYSPVSDSEKVAIINNLIPARILIDYNKRDIERKALEPLLWANTKPFLKHLIRLIFKFSKDIITMKKKMLSKIWYINTPLVK
jgi:glycosyltransferase involved in cell wall biosynthesis